MQIPTQKQRRTTGRVDSGEGAAPASWTATAVPARKGDQDQRSNPAVPGSTSEPAVPGSTEGTFVISHALIGSWVIADGVDIDALIQQLSKNSAWIIVISILGSKEFVSRITAVMNDKAATSSENTWGQQWGGERTAVLWKIPSRADAVVSACDVAHVAKDMRGNKETIHEMWTFAFKMARDGDAPLRIGVIARGSGLNCRCWSDTFETAVMDAIANGPVHILAGMFTFNAQNAKTLGGSARIVFFQP